MPNYILAIDQGTTSSRAIVFDIKGQPIATGQEEFTQHYPNNGWVEHDANDIWQSTLRSCQQAIKDANIGSDDLLGIGITNQRETTILWDRESGEPIANAIVWQDRRTSDYCQQLRAQGHEQSIQEKTGLLLDPYFSASKIRWLLDSIPGARAKADAGQLAFGTVDSFLLWKLTDGQEHSTDATNASRTMLFNIHEQCWDKDLLQLFDIPESLLPEVKDCAAEFGLCNPSLFGKEIPILGIAGDQQAALIGQACFEPGMAKSTYGTGCFFMLNTGEQALDSHNRLLTTVAYRLNGQAYYALEGSIFIAGAAIQWLRDGLHLISDAAETEALAKQTDSDHGVYLVPAFTGLGAPYWDPEARGALFGLTRDTGIKELVTAGLESVCYQTKDLQKAMEADGQRPVNLRVDGGMTKNNWVLQKLADILGATIDRPSCVETTALGAAYLVALQGGVFSSTDDICQLWQLDRRFDPQLSKHERDRRYQGWQDAVNRVRSS
ncbi:glycerol kinase GlpK [Pseudoteredinibacter isoporae]|uniref:Glycerol kinase n=1 Tax=Pseudoteredinibacter isoporae TaxID=570281 RepID=A0A7X0JU04_9GAMM|nr:glycerol kinase [Pseudoteredinibacter isoporae]NHO86936.1 glycerol kinase GlpK [Pseudoteredinibacter isoporae]NIB24611.1 glycerol kinase GlpK [Pseudoteredinibacter isoporae]